MAVEALTRFTCDRCNNIIQETRDSGASEERGGQPLIYLEAAKYGRDCIRFDDLCEKCDTRVAALLDQLDLSKASMDQTEAAPAPQKKKKKPKTKKNNSAEASVDAAGTETPSF